MRISAQLPCIFNLLIVIIINERHLEHHMSAPSSPKNFWVGDISRNFVLSHCERRKFSASEFDVKISGNLGALAAK